MADARSAEARGFWEFYREYARTGVHAASTAVLTALGLMTFVNRWFAALAIAAYVGPPLYLYAANDGGVAGVDDAGGRRAVGARATASTRLREAAGGPWSAVPTPTEKALFDAVAVGEEAYAVGDDGVVLRRGADGWETAIEDGPAGESKALRGVDATADGEAVWIAGDGGALGRYDAETGLHADRSAPEGNAGAWADVAVAGPAGEESILLADGGGGVLRGERRGGEIEWGERRKPGSGSSASAADLLDVDVGYVCDTNATVFEIAEGGRDRTFEVGDGALTGVAVDGGRSGGGAGGESIDGRGATDPTVRVAAADGAIHRYDGRSWTRTRPTERALRGIDAEGDAAVACGEGGIVCERSADGWESRETPAEATLRGVAVGGVTPVAVGDEGAVLEREGG